MRWRRRMDDELERDIQEHIEFETEQNIASGMSAQDARYAAIRKFGNIARVKEDTGSVWTWVWLETLCSDFRLAGRKICRSPGTAVLAALSIAIAFGPSVAMFAVMDRLFLTPVPFHAPDEIAQIGFRNTRPNATQRFEGVSYPEFQDFRDAVSSFSGLAYQRKQGVFATLNGRRVLLWTHFVSDGYFDVLGIPIRFGPGLSKGLANVVISHGLWQREFGGANDVVGQRLLINDQSFTIGGVGTPEFRGTERVVAPDLWLPIEPWLQLQPSARPQMEQRQQHEGTAWARLRPGVSLTQANADVETAARAIAQRWPDTNRYLAGFAWDGANDLTRGGRAITALGVIVLGILLAVACANVAGVLFVHAEERRHETAVRQALGASRLRLIREWIVESVILATAGAVVGLVAARALLNLVPLLQPSLPIPVHFDFMFGPRVWLYAAALLLVSAVSFGTIPAWRGSRPDILSGLRNDSAVSLLRVRVPVRSLLIVAQVAGAEVLLFGAGLVLDNLSTLQRADIGFDHERVVVIAGVVPTGDFSLEDLSGRLSRLAGVQHVT